MVNVIFNLTDSGGNPTKSKLFISPVNAPLTYSGSIVSDKTVHLKDCSGTATIELVPTAYIVRETGYEGGTQFLIDLSQVADNTTVSASLYLVTETPVPSLVTGIYTGIYSNPNSYIAPVNANVAAWYYSDSNSPGIWCWSISTQQWYQVAGF